LNRLTDDFGVWQFFENNQILRSEGYALDDSTRALIVYLLYSDQPKAKVCLDYIERSLKDGKFVGFWNEDRQPIVFPSSEDAHALAVWALSYSVANDFQTDKATRILNQINPDVLENSGYIRTQSYALISNSLLKNQTIAEKFAKKIINQYDSNLEWFEKELTYANAIIPYALLNYLELLSESDQSKIQIESVVKQAIKTLEHYSRIDNVPSPVGSDHWQKIGDDNRTLYGQQPIDAGFMVLLLVKAHQYFKDDNYKTAATEWMDWFYGNNIVKTNLINPEYACADWIKEQGVSTNYGSESTIIYLWAQKVYNQLYE
jgi:hypothetical protein